MTDFLSILQYIWNTTRGYDYCQMHARYWELCRRLLLKCSPFSGGVLDVLEIDRLEQFKRVGVEHISKETFAGLLDACSDQ